MKELEAKLEADLIDRLDYNSWYQDELIEYRKDMSINTIVDEAKALLITNECHMCGHIASHDDDQWVRYTTHHYEYIFEGKNNKYWTCAYCVQKIEEVTDEESTNQAYENMEAK